MNLLNLWRKRARRVCLALCALAWWSGVAWPEGASGQSLTNFGYRKMATRATWTTLCVLNNFPDTGLNGTPAYWHDFVFNPNATNGANRFFSEVSNGRFQLATGATIVVAVPTNWHWKAVLNTYGDPPATRLYHSNLVSRALSSGLFQYAPLAVGGKVTDQQLLHLFLAVGEGGAVRNAGEVRVPGTNVYWDGQVATTWMSSGQGPFAVMCHELSHLFGAIDLYGIWGTDQETNRGLSLMGAQVVGSTSYLCHLDAWHKMQFGWSEPRVFSIATDGSAAIPAAHLGQTNAPVLLYDPAHGMNEFFLLEYRATSTVSKAGYDRVLSPSAPGLVIWQVYQNADKESVQYPQVAYPNAEKNWYECKHCVGLVRSADFGRSCTGTNTGHAPKFIDSNGNPIDMHVLPFNDPKAPGESGWRRCTKCGMLFMNAFVALSDCPAGGQHAGGTTDYVLNDDPDFIIGHNNWKRCTKCQSLIFSERAATTPCAGGGLHAFAAKPYSLLTYAGSPTVQSVSAPDMQIGGDGMWNNTHPTTSNLYWYNRTRTPYTISVRPFTPGADSIVVDWKREKVVWAQFTYTGAVENGGFDTPYKTLGKAYTNTPVGWTLRIKASQTAERMRMNKAIRIESTGGTSVLGRP